MSANLAAGQTYRFQFTSTFNGAPTALGGTPSVKVYKDGSATESAAGVTLTASHDNTGQNLVEIDTSADPGFYSAGSDVSAVITAGTVGGIAQVGRVVETFSIQHQYMRGTDNAASQTSVEDLPTNAELSTALAAADDAVLAQVALVKAKTDNLP